MTGSPDYNEKMIAAKAKMLERFKKDKAERSEAQQRNRLPPGQTWSKGFPVLDLGIHPPFDENEWRFKVWGEVENPITLSWKQFQELPRTGTVSDFHCVTTWS